MIKKYIIVFFIYVFFLFVSPAFAQISQLLFLHEVVRSAIDNNPEIQSARSRLNVTRAEILSASVLQNPFFTFDSNLVENSYDFGLQRIFELGGLKDKRKNIATIRHELEGISVRIREFELKNKVRAAYTKHYVNQEKYKAFCKLYEKVENLLENRHDHKYKEIDKYKEEAILFQGKVTLLDIDNNIEKSLLAINQSDMLLEKLIGKSIIEQSRSLVRPEIIPAALKPFANNGFINIDSISVEQLANSAFKNRGEFDEIDKFMELAESQRIFAMAKRWPLVILEAGATVNFNQNKTRPFVSANIELPFLDKEKDEIDIADEKIKHNKERLNILKRKIQIEVKDAYQTFKHSKIRFDKLDKYILPKAKKHLDELREHYENGKITLKDMIDTEKAVIDIINTYFDSLMDYENAIIELDKAVGVFELTPISRINLEDRLQSLSELYE